MAPGRTTYFANAASFATNGSPLINDIFANTSTQLLLSLSSLLCYIAIAPNNAWDLLGGFHFINTLFLWIWAWAQMAHCGSTCKSNLGLLVYYQARPSNQLFSLLILALIRVNGECRALSLGKNYFVHCIFLLQKSTYIISQFFFFFCLCVKLWMVVNKVISVMDLNEN